MAQSPAMVRVLLAHPTDFDDEDPLLGAMTATLPKGDAALDPIRMAEASQFPLANKMALALSPRRVVVYRTGWGGKVTTPVGTVPQGRLSGIEITWNRKLAVVAIAFVDAPAVVVLTDDIDSAEHCRNQFLRLRGRI